MAETVFGGFFVEKCVDCASPTTTFCRCHQRPRCARCMHVHLHTTQKVCACGWSAQITGGDGAERDEFLGRRLADHLVTCSTASVM